jgi:hypothetical protein
MWHSSDKSRKSERSRLIAPALAQAIDASSAEVEEILLSKSTWIDISDDLADDEKEDMMLARNMLLEDLALVKAKDAAKMAVLNAAIFGTGIIKLNVVIDKQASLVRDEKGALQKKEVEKVYVMPEAIRPDEFIPDPSATTINEMLGCAVKFTKPMHYVLEKIAAGEYRKSALATLAPGNKYKTGNEVDYGVDAQATLNVSDADPVEIIEWQGKVPAAKLAAVLDPSEPSPLDELLNIEADDETMVEAIVVVAQGGTILKAMANPFTMNDRGIIASPWEAVPGRFWGRGVAEKGWNPQKALDSELRARQDSLGYISAPMIGVDSGRIPKGFRMEVKPGKVWLTNGPPRDIIQPVEMGTLQAATFNQTSEMERMVQMGTGAFDTAQALNGQSSSGANAAGSNSLMMGAFVKRAKRSASTIESNLIEPLIRKSLWRYMQFDPERYPTDFKFRVVGAMGIVAREVESMQLTQLLGMMPENVQPTVHLAVTKGIVEMSSVTNKAEVIGAIDEAMKPPSKEDQARAKELKDVNHEAAKAEATQKLLDNQLTMAQIRKTLNEALVAARKASVEERKTDQEEARILLQLQELEESRTANQLDNRRLDIEQQRVDIEARKVASE